MLAAEVVTLLESGCALIVGLVTASGAPLAARGWGLTVVDAGTRARVLLAAAEIPALGYATDGEIGSMIAATGASVRSLQSAQLKGPLERVEPAEPGDRVRMAAYCDAFFADVAEVDAIPRSMMERGVPVEVVACEFTIVEAYDQTPGPAAGAPLVTPGP